MVRSLILIAPLCGQAGQIPAGHCDVTDDFGLCVCEQSVCKHHTFAQETIHCLYLMFSLMVVYSLSISDLYHKTLMELCKYHTKLTKQSIIVEKREN